MFVGGLLIRRFDGFRRLCRHTAEAFQHPLSILDSDMIVVNRTLAALGGPPAPPLVRGSFEGDGLALLLLFLLTHEMECRIGLLCDTTDVLGRLKGLVHLLGHALYPALSKKSPLALAEAAAMLGPAEVRLRPLIRYDSDGEPVDIASEGAAGLLRTSLDEGPYTLTVAMSEATLPTGVRVSAGALHPALLLLA